MSRTDKLQNSPTSPGDTVRDKKTKTDYVVQNIVTLSAGGGLLYYLLRASDGYLDQYKGKDLEDIGMQAVRKNIEELTPEEVLKDRADLHSRVLKGNQEILSKIETEEGAVFRAMLSIINDTDDKTLQEKLLGIATNLVESSKHNMSEQEVLEIIRSSLGENQEFYSEEYLEDVARDLTEKMKSSSKMNYLRPKKFIPPKFEGILSQDEFKSRVKNRGPSSFGRKKGLETPKFAMSRDNDFLNEIRFKWLGDNDKYIPEFLKKIGQEPGKGTAISKRAQYLATIAWGGIPGQKVTAGLFNNSKNGYKPLLGSMLDRASSTGKYNFDDALKDAEKGRMTSSGANELFESAYLDYRAKNVDKLRFKKLRNRRTAAQARHRNKSTKRYSLDQLKANYVLANPAEVFPNGEQRMFSIDKKTLFTDILEGKTLKYNKSTITLQDKALGKILNSQLPNSSSINISALTLRKLSDSTEVELEDLLKEHKEIEAKLTLDEVSTLKLKHNILRKNNKETLTQAGQYVDNPVVEFSLNMHPEMSPESYLTEKSVIMGYDEENRTRKFYDYTQLDEVKELQKRGKLNKLTFGELPEGASISDFDIETIKFKPLQLQAKQATPQYIDAKPVETNADYMRVRNQSRLGFAMLEESTGNKPIRLLGTDSLGPVQEHLRRGLEASQMLGEGSLIFDVSMKQVAHDPKNGKAGTRTVIERMGLGYKDIDGVKSIVDFNGGDELNALLRVAESFEKAQFVGTQWSYHFEEILDRIRVIAKRPNLAKEIVEFQGESISGDLAIQKIERIFEATRAKKNYDLLVLTQASGKFDIGNASVREASRRLLNEKEIRGGMDAVDQKFRIRDELGLENISFKGMADTNNSTIYYNPSDGGTSLRGAYKLKAFETDEVGGKGMVAVMENLIIQPDGTFVETGEYSNLTGTGANSLGLRFRKFKSYTVEDDRLSAEAVKDINVSTKTVAHSDAHRIINDLNFFNKTKYQKSNVTSQMTDQLFGFHEFVVSQEVNKLLTPEVLDDFDARIGKGLSLTKAIDTLVDRAYIPGNPDNAASFTSSLRLRLREALTDQSYREMYTQELTPAMESDFGQTIGRLIRDGMDGDTDKLRQAMLMVKDVMSLERPGEILSQPYLNIHSRDTSGGFSGPKLSITDNTTPEDFEAYVRRSAVHDTFMDSGRTGNKNEITKLFNDVGARNNLQARDMALDTPIDEITTPSVVNKLKSSSYKKRVQGVIATRINELHTLADEHELDTVKQIQKNLTEALEKSFMGAERADLALKDFITGAYAVDKNMTVRMFQRKYNEGLGDLIPKISQQAVADMEREAGETISGLGERTPLLDNVFSEAEQLMHQLHKEGANKHTQQRIATEYIKQQAETIRSSEPGNLMRNLNEVAARFTVRQSAAEKTTVTMNEAAQKVATTAATANEHSDTVFREAIKAQHEGILGTDMFDVGKNKKIVGALLLVGGLTTLLMANKNPEEKYSGGNASKNSPGVIGAQSEIPGDPTPARVFTGGTQPFQLNLDMKTFVNNKYQQRALEEKVSHIVNKYSNGNMTKDENTTQGLPVRLAAYEQMMADIR